MARFFGEIFGTRGKGSRIGHKEISSHTRGWHSGVEVHGRPHTKDETKDVFTIYMTAGSNRTGSDKFLGTVQLDENEKPIFIPAT